MKSSWHCFYLIIVIIASLSLAYKYFLDGKNKSPCRVSEKVHPQAEKTLIGKPTAQAKEASFSTLTQKQLLPYYDKQISGSTKSIFKEPLPKVFWGYLKLTGTSFYGHNHPLNRAVIDDLAAYKRAAYSLNSTLPYGSKLIQIMKDRIVLEKNGLKKYLNMFDCLDDSGEREDLSKKGYRRVTQNEWLIKPNNLLKDNKYIVDILRHTEISPYRNSLGEKGLQINNLGQESLIAELGVEKGDIVKTVNGEEIGELADVLSMYQKVGQTPLINIEIERNNQPQKLSYRIIPGEKPKYDVRKVLQTIGWLSNN